MNGIKKTTVIVVLLALLVISIIFTITTMTDRSKLFKAFDRARADLQDLMKLTSVGSVGSIHEHFDLKVYIDGKPMDFSKTRYQLKSAYIHLEEGIGEVVHIHATGITLQHFFNTIEITLNENCMTVDANKMCSVGGKTLRYYANGKLIEEKEDYVPKDFDKILITYGDETEAEIQQQIASLTSLSEELS